MLPHARATVQASPLLLQQAEALDAAIRFFQSQSEMQPPPVVDIDELKAKQTELQRKWQTKAKQLSRDLFGDVDVGAMQADLAATWNELLAVKHTLAQVAATPRLQPAAEPAVVVPVVDLVSDAADGSGDATAGAAASGSVRGASDTPAVVPDQQLPFSPPTVYGAAKAPAKRTEPYSG